MLTAPLAVAASDPPPDSASAQVAATVDGTALKSAVDSYSMGDPNTAADLAAVVAPEAGRDLDTATDVDLRPDGSFALTQEANGVELGLRAQGVNLNPDMVDGMAVSPGVITDLDIVARVTSNGAQVLAILGSEQAPNRLSFDLDLPEGAELTELPDGSIVVSAPVETERETSVDSSDPVVEIQPIAEITSPWAVDARGEPVETHFELDGTTLIQVVETNQETVFPVVADPSAWWWTKNSTICVAQIASAVLPIKLAAVSAKIAKMAKTNSKFKKIKKAIDQLGGLKKTLGYLRTYIMKKGKGLSKKNKERVENLLKLGGNTLAEMMGIGTCWRIVDEIRK